MTGGEYARRLLLMLVLALSAIQVAAPEEARERTRVWRAEVARLATILKTLPTDFDKTTFLRQYAGGLIDIGRLDSPTERRYRSLDFESFDAAEFYPLFQTNKVPADCGITSFFYIKLLQALGFKAYQYSFGFTAKPFERFIHSVALVDIAVRNTRRLIIQDVYLNLTYRDAQGEPIDIADFLIALKQKNYQRIVMDPGSVTTLLLVPEPQLYYRYLSESCQAAMAKALMRPDGSRKTELTIARDYATLVQNSCDGFESGFLDALRRNGFPEPFIYAYTLRASDMVGTSDHSEVQRRIDRILR